MTNFITFLLISIILVLIILIATYLINFPSNDYEKHSAYESGFEPFGDARSFFDIQFYTIGLLFIIFDLEVVFLIPIVIDISNISLYGYICFLIFLFIVLLGFYYEWAIGLLNWLPTKVKAVTVNTLIGVYIPTELLLYLDLIFVFISFLIIFLLLLNCLNNLIYRVINLAGLSLITVGMWIYFTDFIFLYIVYILAFVGAVIMLFLSVILMLPSSITLTIDNKMLNLLLITTEIVIENSFSDYLVMAIFFGIIFNLLYLFLDFSWCVIDLIYDDVYVYFRYIYLQIVNVNFKKIISKIFNLPFITTEVIIENSFSDYLIIIIIFGIIFNILYLFLRLTELDYSDIHTLFRYIYLQIINIDFKQLSINKILQNTKIAFKCIISFFYKLLGLSVPSDTYGAYTKNPLNFSAIPKFAFIGMFIHDCLNFFYLNIESKLYGPISKNMYYFTQPVWGNLFKVLEYGYAPARSINHINWPIPDIRKQYIPVQLKISLFKIFPEPVQVSLILYIHGNSFSIIIINRLIFIINCLIFFIINIMILIFYKLIKLNTDLLLYMQFIISSSIFFSAVPYKFVTTNSNFSNLHLNEYSEVDNLLAIKSILYEGDFSYLLISVISLLVALIGSAIFTRNLK